MKYRFIIVLIAIIIFSCQNKDNKESLPQSFVKTQNPSLSGFDNNRLSYLDSMFSKYTEEKILPNAVTFVSKNGVIVHHKAYGYKDLEKQEKVKTDDIFRIASQSKAITTAALMTLYEKGLFVLDDRLSKFIPEFANPRVLVEFNDKDTTYKTRPASGEITIRHLLTHTSGIHYGMLDGGKHGMMFAKEGIPAVNSLDDISTGEVVKRIAKMPLEHDPGDRFTYGMNSDVVGYLIEILSGQPFDVFLKETIFDPLGMNDTYFYLPGDKVSRMVKLYSSSSSGLKVHQNESYQTYPYAGAQTFLSGGAGLCGTVEDYAKFCQMLLNHGEFNGNKILSRKTIELMTRNQIGNSEVSWSHHKFGLGFELIDENAASHHLWSPGSYKWGGMYYTDYLIDPTENMILLIYTNIEPYRGPSIHERFHNVVYQSLK